MNKPYMLCLSEADLLLDVDVLPRARLRRALARYDRAVLASDVFERTHGRKSGGRTRGRMSDAIRVLCREIDRATHVVARASGSDLDYVRRNILGLRPGP